MIRGAEMDRRFRRLKAGGRRVTGRGVGVRKNSGGSARFGFFDFDHIMNRMGMFGG